MMRTPLVKWATPIALVVLTIVPVWAQSGNYRHEITVYGDSQGGALSAPAGVAFGGKRLLVADSGNSRLLLYTLDGDTVKLDTQIKLMRQVRPTTVQIGPEGSLLVYDSRAKQILQFDAGGKSAGIFEPQNMPDGTRIIIKSFRVDGSGNVYMLDIFGRRVVVLDRAGVFIRQIGYPEEFGFISDLAVGKRGSVFVLDSVQSQVFVAEPGTERFVALSEKLPEDLPYPTHIEIDSRGLLYIVDEESGSVGIMRRDGSFSGKMFNRGRKEGLLYYPAQLCIRDDGWINIADRDNNRVQVFKEKE